MQIFGAIRSVQTLLHAEICSRNVWQDPVFQGFHIVPILGQVLAARQKCLEESQNLELFRLAAVLYISALRAPFGIDTTSTETLYASKIHTILLSLPSIEGTPPTMMAWVLSVAFTSNCDTDMKHYFGSTLRKLTASMHIADIEKLKNVLETVVWDEVLLASQSFSLLTLFLSKEGETAILTL